MSKPVRDSLRKILADGALLQVDPEGQVQLSEKNYSVTLGMSALHSTRPSAKNGVGTRTCRVPMSG